MFPRYFSRRYKQITIWTICSIENNLKCHQFFDDKYSVICSQLTDNYQYSSSSEHCKIISLIIRHYTTLVCLYVLQCTLISISQYYVSTSHICDDNIHFSTSFQMKSISSCVHDKTDNHNYQERFIDAFSTNIICKKQDDIILSFPETLYI